MSLRLGAYIDSSIEGHTGAFPEKVEALGRIPREAGEHVSMICEVSTKRGTGRVNQS